MSFTTILILICIVLLYQIITSEWRMYTDARNDIRVQYYRKEKRRGNKPRPHRPNMINDHQQKKYTKQKEIVPEYEILD